MRLNFSAADYELVRCTHKSATIRFSDQAARCEVGERLLLAFGQRDRPLTLEAVCTKSVHFDLTEALAAWTDHEHESEHSSEPFEPSLEFSDEAFLMALGASYGTLLGVLTESDRRNAWSCTAIWWKLETPREHVLDQAA